MILLPSYAPGFRPGFSFLSPATAAATTIWSAALSSTSWTIDGLVGTKNASAAGGIKATKALSTGRAYFEIKATAANGIIRLGTATPAIDINGLPGQTGIVYYQNNGNVVSDAATVGTFATYAVNDVIGFDVNRSANTIALYKNGTLITTVTGVSAGDLAPYGYNGTAGTVFEMNAGQSPFTGGLPSGSAPWG